MRAHTSHEFDQELRELKELLLSMGGRCERMIEMATRALSESDPELAREVITLDRDNNLDELAVDELAIRVLALRQPVGRDLRFTMTAVKVVTDLERVGDEAVNLAERVEEQAGLNPLPTHTLLKEMAGRAGKMLHDALDAFVREDTALAREVFSQDDAVDELHERALFESIEFMANHSERVAAGMRAASCSKYLERIADHATNIAEMVIYLAEGTDVRHPGATNRKGRTRSEGTEEP